MVHIANSTLAGGVAIGTTANVVLNPSHALIVGTVAGALSVVGYEYITPVRDKPSQHVTLYRCFKFMDRRLKIQDT